MTRFSSLNKVPFQSKEVSFRHKVDLILTSTNSCNNKATLYPRTREMSAHEEGELVRLEGVSECVGGLDAPLIQGVVKKWRPGYWCGGRWSYRTLVVQGTLLYKFDTGALAEGQTVSQCKPKGSPIDLTHVSIRQESPESNMSVREEHVFSVSNIDKITYFAVESEEELHRWISALNEAKALAIKIRMGHLDLPREQRQAELLGRALLEKSISRKNRCGELENSVSAQLAVY